MSSNNVAFGDVGDEIQFIGTIASDTASASGSYTNPGLSDEGTYLWNADVNKRLIFRLDTEGGNINQLPPFEFNYLTFDGTHSMRGRDEGTAGRDRTEREPCGIRRDPTQKPDEWYW